MRKNLFYFGSILILVLSMGQFALAGKIEDVQSQLKRDCQKEITSQQALPLVRTLFLSCTPKTKIVIEGCQVNCLKENIGAVIGR